MTSVNSVLTERLASFRSQRRWPVLVVSICAHIAILVLGIVAPMLAAGEKNYPEYVSVTIVPIQALGVRNPQPAQVVESRPAPPKPKTPDPEPPKTEPAPEKEPPKPAPATGMASPDSSRKKSSPASATPPAASQGPAQRQGSPKGSSFGSSAFGASVGFDNPDFTYSYYVDQMLAMIRDQWTRPPIGGEVEVMVHFRIHSDGSVSEVGIARSSGFNQFDLAGLRAIQSAAPLPPLPKSYRHDSLGVNLIMR